MQLWCTVCRGHCTTKYLHITRVSDLSEDFIVDLHAYNGSGCFVSALADHDGVGGRHRGLSLADVEGDGVDEGLVVDVVIVNRPLVPRLVGSFVVEVSKVPEYKKERGGSTLAV